MCSILDEQELDDSDDVPQAGDMVCGFISGADTGAALNVGMACVLVGIGGKDNPVFA